MRCTYAVALLSALVLGLSGCERKDYGTVTIPADHTSYTASDYSLRLPPGWYGHAASGGINYYPPDAHAPFRTNVFIKTGRMSLGGVSSGMSIMQREMGELLTDSTTWDEQPVRIGVLSGRQARFSGTLAVPGAGPSSVQGLMVAVSSGQRGYAILFISKTADYSRYESSVEQIIASFQPK